MLQNDITILSTAILDEEVLQQALDRNIQIGMVPFIATKPVADTTLQAILKPLAQEHAFVVFTSTKAVEAVAANLENSPTGWTFFCIGYATRKLVEKYFGNSSMAAVADNGAALAKEIIKWGVQDELIFFCGDQRRNELPDQLRAAGIWLREIITYETKLTPQKIDRNFDGVLFFSPSAVQSFFSVNQLSTETVLFSIGHTTEQELNKHSTNKIIVADKPEKEAVIKKVIEHFKK